MDSELNAVIPDPLSVKDSPVRAPFPWRYAAMLLFASLVASVLVLPFTAALLVQTESGKIPAVLIPVVLTIQVVVEGVFSVLMILLGLGLGRSLGLVWPPLDGWDAGPDRGRRVRSALVVATALGVVSGGLIQGLGHAMAGLVKSDQHIVLPSWWACLLASVGAGVREEVWLRLGLMTFFVWLAARLARQSAPGAGLIWSANLIACLLFGAMHLPQAAALLGLTAPLVAFVFLGNGVPGLIFGWLYWRKGLVAAMVSHTVADIVSKVVLPLFGL
jgi:membrane protease YdiL (CAAX protease family)